jgi:ubiquinone/menaquinone biosynthesis C-methylase UbiE
MTTWKTFYKEQEQQDLAKLMEPDDWQKELVELIMHHRPTSCLEAGCGYGLTSLLLNDCITTLLDLEQQPLITSRLLHKTSRKTAAFTAGDLLSIPFGDQSFDLTFNSGVLEHFDFDMRCRALAEMERVTTKNGKIIIAIPNHYSIPYRYSYKYRKQRGEWPYPDEQKLYDFSQELQTLKLPWLTERKTISVNTAFHFLRRHQRIFMKMRSFFQSFEGYLTVITIHKDCLNSAEMEL